MYKWKLAKSLGDLNQNEWDILLSSEPQLVHPERVYSYCLAREALRLILLQEGRSVSPERLKLEHFSSLSAFPEFTLSLSHTKKVGAALLAFKSEYLSVGIDVEENSRVVRDEIIQKVSHPQDQKLRNLDLWCLKEAAFKCLMNSQKFSENIPFSQIQVGEKEWMHPASGARGVMELKLLPQETVALAFWKN